MVFSFFQPRPFKLFLTHKILLSLGTFKHWVLIFGRRLLLLSEYFLFSYEGLTVKYFLSRGFRSLAMDHYSIEGPFDIPLGMTIVDVSRPELPINPHFDYRPLGLAYLHLWTLVWEKK